MATVPSDTYCDTCKRLMTVDGLRQAQTAEGFAFGTLKEFSWRSLADCQLCMFLRQSVDCYYSKPLRLVITAGTDKHSDEPKYYLDSMVGKWGIQPFHSLSLYEIPEWDARYHVTALFAVASPGPYLGPFRRKPLHVS
jgi:hypothetical protein